MRRRSPWPTLLTSTMGEDSAWATYFMRSTCHCIWQVAGSRAKNEHAVLFPCASASPEPTTYKVVAQAWQVQRARAGEETTGLPKSRFQTCLPSVRFKQ